MGLLVAGTPLPWNNAVDWFYHVRRDGILQFIGIYSRTKEQRANSFKWGDELEYGVFVRDPTKKTIKLSLGATNHLQKLSELERNNVTEESCNWMPEYGAWMIEGTPYAPYDDLKYDMFQVERNMRLRRIRLLSILQPDEICPTLTAFPLLGIGDFTVPSVAIGGPISQSKYISDAVINPHPRYGTMTAFARERRGGPANALVPIYKDKLTDTMTKPHAGYVHMDAHVFGGGMCGLQVTFQAKDMDESRILFDQLAVLAPIMLALTAATPILKGKLVDTDARWNTLVQSCDDRTPNEHGTSETAPKVYGKLAGKGMKRIPTSRWSCISAFIGDDTAQYNDLPLPIDEEFHKMLTANGVESLIARHIAHLFARDPLAVFTNKLYQDNETQTDHFEGIQSTNWQTVRWKPPPNENIGWRTEFRPMEIQLTDFENAAFSVFMSLLARAVITFNINMYIPISKVHENMDIAHKRNAVIHEKFHFRMNESSMGMKSIREIMLDEDDGLIPLVQRYLDHMKYSGKNRSVAEKYLSFIGDRATGKLLTPATWMRRFVQRHTDYCQDSVVSSSIAFDLMDACAQIGEGLVSCPDLHGDIIMERIERGPI